MRAAVLNEVDAPFVLRDVADPVAEDDEALVHVRAAGINFVDVLIRRGRYPQMPEFPVVLGSEIAGELEDGSRVMVLLGRGGYGELAAVERTALVPLPKEASFAPSARATWIVAVPTPPAAACTSTPSASLWRSATPAASGPSCNRPRSWAAA